VVKEGKSQKEKVERSETPTEASGEKGERKKAKGKPP
jgi:hypothetical protein